MFSSIILISLSTAISAIPLTRRFCVPNFQGAGFAIVNADAGEWVASSLSSGADVHTSLVGTFDAGFRIEQDGAYPTGFIIKSLNVPANNLVVSSAASSLSLQEINQNDKAQGFNVTCDSCGDNFSGCTFSSLDTELCVQSSKESGALSLQSCDGSAGQSFEIVPVTPA